MSKDSALSAASGQQSATLEQARRVLGATGMLPGLIVLIVIGAIVSPAFLSVTNISNVLRISAPLGLIAVGQTLVILSGRGGIDLSVGTVMAAAAVVGAGFADHGLAAVILASLAAGAFFGLVNGLGVVTAGLQPFIVTLATLTIARGIGYELTQAQPIILNLPSLSYLARGQIAFVSVPIVILLVVLVVGQLILSRTVFGRTLYSVGGNDEAAYASGVNVRAYRLGVYVISGTLAGMAGVLGMAQLSTADPNFGNGYELQSIAAVVVGGALLSGGKGTIAGTAIGVLIMALVANILNLVNVNPWTQLIVTGLIVVVVVAANSKHEAATRDPRVLKGLPLFACLLLGAAILYGVLK